MTEPRDPASSHAAPDAALERVVGQRASLRAVAGALARLLDPREVAEQILDAACTVLDAPQGWVVIPTDDGEAVEMLATVGFAPEVVAPWARVPMSLAVPMIEVVRTGQPLDHRTAQERRTAFPAPAIPDAGRVDTEGSAVVPLGVQGRVLGSLAVSFRAPRVLDDDERWFLESLASHGSHALERARLFAEVQERDRMLEAEREAAHLRDAFIGVVSHELRTPITTIFGGTRVLARRWRELGDGARDDILRDIVEESDRLYRLVEDLLVLTRVERGTLDLGDEPIHLGRLLERVVASERSRWPDVRFETRVMPALPSAAGEDTYAEQVLRNLLGNAAKYGGAGSTVTVAADADEGSVRLLVLDEGPGVDESESDLLFDLFYRSPATAAGVSGAGIGLFVCRQLVRAMGGTIEGARRPEGGAAFTVTLQRYQDDGLP